MRKIQFSLYAVAVIALLLSGCFNKRISNLPFTITPAQYRTTIPFQVVNGVIRINVKINDDADAIMSLDNNSPTSIIADSLYLLKNLTPLHFKAGLLTPDQSFGMMNLYQYRGGFRIGQVLYNNFYIRGHHSTGIVNADSLNRTETGILGYDIIRNGIWIFDFKNNILRIASDIGEADLPEDAIKISARFNISNRIFLRTKIEGCKQKVLLDLGYNGSVLIPQKEFNKIHFKGNAEKLEGMSASLSGQRKASYQRVKNAGMVIDGNNFTADVISNNIVSIRHGLLGVSFFQQYHFLILDFVNHAVYMVR